MMDAQIPSMHASMPSFMSSSQNSYQQSVSTLMPPSQASFTQVTQVPQVPQVPQVTQVTQVTQVPHVAQGVQGMQVPQGTNSYVYMDSMQQMQPSVVQGGNVMGQSMVNMVGIGGGSDEKYNFPEN